MVFQDYSCAYNVVTIVKIIVTIVIIIIIIARNFGIDSYTVNKNIYN